MAAIACVVGAILANNKSVDIQGPSALVVLPDMTVWVSVDDALWNLNAKGKRLALVGGSTLGVDGRIGNLVLHPNGQLVAQIRNDPTLYFLDPENALIKSRLTPQWPAELVAHGSSAINYAFDENGRVAIATGGGHAVAVFDATGVYLGRTKPSLYEFSNGLWWAANSLWTTDTNRQQLVELDGETFAEKMRVTLTQKLGAWQFLGMAVASHGNASEKTNAPALATLVRFGNGMTKGHVTDVFNDGSQWDFPVNGTPQPRDIKWRGNELLMVDGASFAIKRYSANHEALADFGDTQVQAELSALLAIRDNYQNQYHLYFGAAVLIFLLGLSAAVTAQYMEKMLTMKSLGVGLSRLGTPVLSFYSRLVMIIKIFWPGMVMFTVLSLLILGMKWIPGSFTEVRLGMLLFAFVATILSFIFFVISMRRAVADPACEGLFNFRAVQFFQSDPTFWKLRNVGELPEEAFLLASGKVGLHLLVLTNQRFLVFAANLRDRTLLKDYARQDIRSVRLLVSHEMSWLQKLHRLVSVGGEFIRIEFMDGTELAGVTLAQHAVRRILQQLQAAEVATPVFGEVSSVAQTISSRKVDRETVKYQCIASFLVPGLGQWMQGRSGTALLFFLIWIPLMMSAVVVAWTLWETLAAVSPSTITYTAAAYLFVCVVAAGDVWRMQEWRSKK